MSNLDSIKIAVIGLGYVGLPVALAFGKKFPGTVGFDVNVERVRSLASGVDQNADVEPELLKDCAVTFTDKEADLQGVNFFVIAVPTPIDDDKRPDLRALAGASEMVAKVMGPGSIVVYESTVYPGLTEDYCAPILEACSGLTRGKDFKLGYSPERINPGDTERTLSTIVKVVSAEDDESLDTVAKVYETIIEAGIHRASSIKVAEAAKVIENTQRDLNIALMNELALIFDRMDICTNDVIEAAATKWNFLKFYPGLVGGHCIGVDPFYLTTKAQQLGYQPEVILAGRRINDGMGRYVARKTIKLMTNSGTRVKDARIGVMGLTFKENVGDIRNSQVPSIVRELSDFGASPLVYDPLVCPDEAKHEYGIELCQRSDLKDLDALVLAVSHQAFLDEPTSQLEGILKSAGVIVDVKAMLEPSELAADTIYWRL